MLNWKVNKRASIAGYAIPCVDELSDQYEKQEAFYKSRPLYKEIGRAIILKYIELRNFFLVDGFIEVEVSKWIKKYAQQNSVIIDIGCGDMSLSKYIPRQLVYNAIDIKLMDFHLSKIMKKKDTSALNICLASATNIPLEDNSVTMILSTECFEHIPEINKAIEEIKRISKPGSILICSIPNNYCYKYKKKGPHQDHINNWTFAEFREYIESQGFKYLEGFMKGFWLPFPLWVTQTSIQLPVSHKNEYYNTNFFYVFRKG
jgi:ubiquinone/menaquinone biosynthesis C-methylase UbiE